MSVRRRKLDKARFIITGASSGLGFATAELLMARGAEVWGTSRDLENAAFPRGVHPLTLDLSNPQSVDTFWQENDIDSLELDGVINNAGYAVFGAFERCSFEDVERQLNVLLLGIMQICRRAMPGLRARKGTLVNVSSLASEFPIPYQSVYSAAKAGLSAFSECLMMEEASNGLQIIDFRPGDLCTDFHHRMPLPDSGKRDDRVGVVWNKIQERSEAAPKASLAARKLIKGIESGSSGTIRSGTFFQSVIAPFLDRFASSKMRRHFNMSYYK